MKIAYHENKPIEIIGKIKGERNSGFFVCILNDNRLWGLHYSDITTKRFLTTEEQLGQFIRHLNPTILLKRLNDPHYLPGERSRFLNAIQMCYDLNPTEQRLFLMHLNNENHRQ